MNANVSQKLRNGGNHNTQGIYPQFCVNVKGWCKIKVDRGGVQGSLFAALIAMKQKSCSLSRAAAQPLFIYP